MNDEAETAGYYTPIRRTDVQRPASMDVVVGNYTETDLIVALESVVCQWIVQDRSTPGGEKARARAVRWLFDKYGSQGGDW